MKNLRSYYSAEITEFLKQSKDEILGIISRNNSSTETLIFQTNTWEEEIKILKTQLTEFVEGRILFEYTIPRMGKRVDVLILYKNIIFLLEFKCGDKTYLSSTYDQVLDYALDLRNFQKESHNKLIVPIMVATEAKPKPFIIEIKNRILNPLKCNSDNIKNAIFTVADHFQEPYFDYKAWENSEYLPTPTIVEAAQAMYRGHNVEEITRSDAGIDNLTATAEQVEQIIENCKDEQKKAICFITGVPGAGKTLAGLNIAIQRSDAAKGEHAVFCLEIIHS